MAKIKQQKILDRLSRPSYQVVGRSLPMIPESIAGTEFALEWSSQSGLYEQYEDWYSGRIWDDPHGRFPLGYNPLRQMCIMHRNALFGEADDTAEPLVRTRFLPEPTLMEGMNNFDDPEDDMPDEKRVGLIRRSKYLSRIVNSVWMQSSGRALMADGGLLTQIYGGVAFAIRYVPQDIFLEVPIRIELVSPREFVPIFSAADPWHLLEAYVIRTITKKQAEIYGVNIGDKSEAVYTEHWTRDEYSIDVDGITATISINGTKIPMKGENPYGFVPFVYIPHERESGFYGTPLMHQMEGVLEEINGRAADIGDATRESAHPEYVARNIGGGSIGRVRISDTKTAADLGIAQHGMKDPEVKALDPPILPEQSVNFLKQLEQWSYKQGFSPPVVWGDDEGSQRSALTLAFRMWPFAAHIRNERLLWSEALNVIAEYVIRMISIKGAADARLKKLAVTEDDFNRKKAQNWFPMLPRDQEAQLTSLIQRKQEGLISTLSAIEKFDDVEDAIAEEKRIEEEVEAENERQKELFAQSSRPFGGKPGEGEQKSNSGGQGGASTPSAKRGQGNAQANARKNQQRGSP